MVPETSIPGALRAVIFFPKALQDLEADNTVLYSPVHHPPRLGGQHVYPSAYQLLKPGGQDYNWDLVGNMLYPSARQPLRTGGQHIISYCTSSPET
jgi:hypothetical protein